MNGDVAATNGTSNEKTELEGKIIKQIEYYFGDYNLPRDKFLQEEIKKDDGWIPLETMTKFKRLASLTTDHDAIVVALKKSTTDLMEIHEDKQKIRRSTNIPLPVFDEDMKEETKKRTVYCKGFPKDGSCTLDTLLEYFKQYGPYDTVVMRHYFDSAVNKQEFKGSVLVVFPAREKAEEFMAIEEVKFKDTHLIRKWHLDYIEEKTQEMAERKARKEARKKQKEEEEAAEVEQSDFKPLPKGTYLHISELKEDFSREDISEALTEFTDQCAFIEFGRGRVEGYIRFKEENSNKDMLEKLQGKLKVKDVEVKLRVVEGEEEEELLKTANQARARVHNNVNSKKGKFGGKRKNMGRHGPNKRKRN
ncbi:lupus La protein homolog B-like [Oratosquilla oratoria]|uniref:lupus La protein homolog B-like n=1 Tax=Oratosquilla oratoria TaxID=337810 RepID=UPI003F76A6CC